MHAYCLSVHATYGCASTGACCTTPWPIVITREQRTALEARRLLPAGTRRGGSPAADDEPDLLLGRQPDGACLFYAAHGSRKCRIHRDAGPALLPTACRNFPRVTLHDPRGTFVTLSHACPTAASLLLRPGRIAIVPAPRNLTIDGQVEGLDARTVLPPLVRPGMLADPAGYGEWEHQGIAALDDAAYGPAEALAIIADATRALTGWAPAAGALRAAVRMAFTDARVRACGARTAGESDPFARSVKAYLASHLFASWSAYQDGGMPGVLASLRTAFAAVDRRFTRPGEFVDAVRTADLGLRHAAAPVP